MSRQWLALLVWAWTLGPLMVPVTAQVPRGLRLIVVETEADALELGDRLRDGASFRVIASTHSLDASATADGYLGAFLPDDLRAEYRAALEDLPPGVVSAPVPIAGRYALLRWMTAEEERWLARRNEGLEAAREGRYAEAGAAFVAAVGEAGNLQPGDPRLAESLNDLAELRRLEGDAVEAIPLYERSLALRESMLGPDHPGLATALNNLAELYRLQRDYGRAEPLFRRSLAIWESVLGPDDPNVGAGLNNLALVRAAQGDYQEAETLAGRALGIWEVTLGPRHPQVASGLNNLATMLRSQGNDDEAEPLVRRALGILEDVLAPRNPAVVETLRSLGEIVLAQGASSEAIGLYERLLEAQWGIGSGSVLAGEVIDGLMQVLDHGFGQGEQLPRSFGSFIAAVDRSEPDATFSLSVSNLLKATGLVQQAEEVLLRVLERDSESRAAHYLLAELYRENGRIPEALDEYARVQTIEGPVPSSVSVLTRIGQASDELSLSADALTAYSEALALDPTHTEALLALGDLNERLERSEDARALYLRVIETDPGVADAYDRLAEVHLRLAELSEAVDAAEKAISLDPYNRRAHYFMGMAHIRMGQAAEGQRSLAEYERLGEEARLRERQLLEVVSAIQAAAEASGMGDDQAAIEQLQASVSAQPDSGRLRLTLGLVQLRAGYLEDAVVTFESMIAEGFGDDSLIHWELSRAHEMIGDPAGAGRHRAMYLERILRELDANRPY